MKRLISLALVLALIAASPALIAASPALGQTAQAAPQAAPQAGAQTGPQSIPLSNQATDPVDEETQKAEEKKQEDLLYTFLVIGCALLPIAGFGIWKLLGSSRTGKSRGYAPHRYATGPADKRRIKRQNMPKKPKDKKERDLYR